MVVDYRLSMDSDDNKRAGSSQMSAGAWLLWAAGAVSVLLSLLATFGFFISSFGTEAVLALLTFAIGFSGMVFLTGGAAGGWPIWVVRLGFPLPATVLVWWLAHLAM